jgi:hypothetical protein
MPTQKKLLILTCMYWGSCSMLYAAVYEACYNSSMLWMMELPEHEKGLAMLVS